jgi:hypothetical protein
LGTEHQVSHDAVSEREMHAVLASMLAEAHSAAPTDLPRLIAEHGRALGATDVVLYLCDYEQRVLVPVPNPSRSDREAVGIDSTLAGRSFRLVTVEVTDAGTAADDGRTPARVWVPVLDGTERLGVLEVDYDERPPEGFEANALTFANLVAELLLTKATYGDIFTLVRRRQLMSLSAELIWQLLPPLTFADERVVIAGALAPAYALGGDAFDYAIDETTARVAIFDAVGHGLRAGTLVTVAVAAYRHARRSGLDLLATVAAIDEAIAREFGDAYFVTATLAELDLALGRLQWCSAGHPRPLLLRNGKIVKTLSGSEGAPLGLTWSAWVAAEELLEPGDRVLLFTDGVVEARDPDGQFFGEERFVDYIVRSSLSGASPPEQLRRLFHAILDHQASQLQDDATAVMVEWRGGPRDALTPTVDHERERS